MIFLAPNSFVYSCVFYKHIPFKAAKNAKHGAFFTGTTKKKHDSTVKKLAAIKASIRVGTRPATNNWLLFNSLVK